MLILEGQFYSNFKSEIMMLILPTSYVDSISRVVPEVDSGGITHSLVTPQRDDSRKLVLGSLQALCHTPFLFADFALTLSLE